MAPSSGHRRPASSGIARTAHRSRRVGASTPFPRDGRGPLGTSLAAPPLGPHCALARGEGDRSLLSLQRGRGEGVPLRAWRSTGRVTPAWSSTGSPSPAPGRASAPPPRRWPPRRPPPRPPGGRGSAPCRAGCATEDRAEAGGRQHDHARPLAALGAVDRQAVGVVQVQQVGSAVRHHPPVAEIDASGQHPLSISTIVPVSPLNTPSW